MSEIVDEDLKAREYYQASLHSQIIISSQNLRVSLQVIDRLMELFNKSNASSKGKDKATA